MNKDSYIFQCLCRGISDETWNKFNQVEKDSYVKNHPHCRFATDPEKTLPTQITMDKPNKELLHRYAKIYNYGDDRRFIEKPLFPNKKDSKMIKEKTNYDYMLNYNYDVIELEDGRLVSVRKPQIQKSYCSFGDYKDIDKKTIDFYAKDGFIKENLNLRFSEENTQIQELENFLNDKKSNNPEISNYPPILEDTYDGKLALVWIPTQKEVERYSDIYSAMTDKEARKNPQDFLRFLKDNGKKNISLLSKKDARKYLDMLNRCKVDFIKRILYKIVKNFFTNY